MLRRLVPCLLVLVTATGCKTGWFGKNDEFVRKPSLLHELRVPDGVDPTEEEEDEWSFVSQEARGNQMLEKDPDPWWQMHFMSAKARNIERNLGIAGPDE